MLFAKMLSLLSINVIQALRFNDSINASTTDGSYHLLCFSMGVRHSCKSTILLVNYSSPH